VKLALIGFPACGKTSLFNAVTGLAAPTGQFSGTQGVQTATVSVNDPRLNALRDIYKPKKFVPAQVECADVSGLIAGDGGRKEVSAELLGKVRQTDVVVAVIRAFKDDNVPHVLNAVDPQRDLAETDSELLFADLTVCEARVEKLRVQVKKPTKSQEQDKRELAVQEKILAQLSEGRAARLVELSGDERKLLASFQYLTSKPRAAVFNVGESDLGDETGNAAKWERDFPGTTALCAKIEMELAQLPEEERREFLQEMNILEPAAARLVRMVYRAAGLISFFTVGPDEVRAWTIHRGDDAVTAAGKIHSDLARGFIRAEVFSYDDLIAAGGSEKEIKARGKLRLEGKEYVVQDGDILCIRHGG
jgi:hypothetical protein